MRTPDPAKIAVDWLRGLGEFTLLTREAFLSMFQRRPDLGSVIYQLYFIGVKSQSVVLITGGFTGMVLAAQTYFQFHRVRMDTATLAVVGVGMCSELGPVLTALMVSGRVGAAMTAELGTMKVTEQIDALRTLATHPVDYLIVPRLIATILALPLLTVESVAVGILGGYALCRAFLGAYVNYAWDNMVVYTSVTDLVTGLIKVIIFGAIIAMVSCYKGMTCGEGAEGVGRATTQAVVHSSIAILISNFFLTLLLNRVFG